MRTVKDVDSQRIIDHWGPLLGNKNNLDRYEQRIESLESELSKLKQQLHRTNRRISHSSITLRDSKSDAIFDSNALEATEELLVKQWLADEVNLPQYFEAFKEGEFDDMESVHDVTEDDLKAMGINKLGHRRKILIYAAKVTFNNID